MRSARWLLMLSLAALVACDDDGISVNPVESAALVRFLNASPEPGDVNLRFIDRVENLPMFLEVPFPGTSGAAYHRVAPGSRHMVVFPHSTNPDVAQQRLLEDPGFSLVADARYSLVLTQESDGHRITRLEDPPTIERAAAGQVALQVLHGATGGPAVDVYVVSTPIPSDWRTNNMHVFRNVSYLEPMGYVNVPVLSGDESLYAFIVTQAGTDGATELFRGTPDLPGEPAQTATTGPQPGVRIEQSVLTIFLNASDDEPVVGVIDRALDPE